MKISRANLTLRHKLYAGFGGLVLTLLLVGGLGVLVTAHYRQALHQAFRENHDSITYCEQIGDALDQINGVVAEAAGTSEAPDLDPVEPAKRVFEQNLRAQLQNIFIDEELVLSRELERAWPTYTARVDAFLVAPTNTRTRAVYRSELLPLYQHAKRLTEGVRDINLRTMRNVDIELRQTLASVQKWLSTLTTLGSLLAFVYVGLVARSILRPLTTLTRSAREIESGNLDLVVAPGPPDEIGQLADAFNSMAARLREFRRLDHERLARTQQTTQLAIDSIPEPIVVLDRGGTIELTNRAAGSYFQLTPGVVKPAWLSDLFDRTTQTGEPVLPEGYRDALQRFDAGVEKFFLPRAVPMRNPDGSVAGVTIILVDVTGMKQIDEAKSDLLSTVSHELKTPLTSFRMAAHLLADESFGTLNERQSELVRTATDNSERLHRLIEHLLAASRIESGRAPLQLVSVEPRALVTPPVESARADFRAAGVALDVDIDDDLPHVRADAIFVGYVLTNLLTNALKHTPRDGRVEIVARRLSPTVVQFNVTDTGSGIEPAHLPHIFKRFYRAPGPTQGAGVGLSIAREIIEVHGQSIEATSVVGQGTTITFTLAVG